MLTIEVLFEGLKVLYVHSSERSSKLEEGPFLDWQLPLAN